MTKSARQPTDREAVAAQCDTKPSGRRESRREINPIVLIDSREQLPFEFANLTAERGTLDTGDYSVKGLEHLVSVERKALDDLLACVGSSRPRFKRELARMQGYRFRLLVVEADAAAIEAGDWCSQLHPNHVLGSLASWTARFCIPVWLSGSHESGARFTERFLYQSARHVVEETQAAWGR